MKYNIGDRVIYDGCPCVIQRSNEHGYKLNTIKWDKDYPYLNTWVHVELIQLDYQYYREQKLNSILND